MNRKISRREVLGFAAGAAAGIALTPAPWKLIDDLAIWTQNWRWIPVPRSGPVTTRRTVCALCPAACPVRARCIGGQPVSLESAADSFALCPLGLGGHHLPWHPARFGRVVRLIHHGEEVRTVSVPFESVVNETARGLMSAANRGETVALLDMRPDRSVSWVWRRMLSTIPSAIAIPAPGREGASLTTLAMMLCRSATTLGLDLQRARMVVSFGGPLLEGWGNKTTFSRLAGQRDEVRLVQIDAIGSATAERANRWLPARPGSEAVLALGLAHVLIAENLVDSSAAYRARDFASYAEIARRFPPERVATVTGVPARAIVATAREMAHFAPTVVLAGEDPAGGRFDRTTETAIHGLNVLLGNVDRAGGIVTRAPLPMPIDAEPLAPVRELDEVESGTISALIVDASEGDAPVPWPSVRRKLRKDSIVVALSPYLAGSAACADRVVPTLPYLETLHELPSSCDAPVATLTLSAPLMEPRREGIDPIEFVRVVSMAMGIEGVEWKSSEELIRARVERIYEAGEGRVVDWAELSTASRPDLQSPAIEWPEFSTPAGATSINVSDFASADDLWSALLDGQTWEGDPRSAELAEFSLLGGSAAALAKLADDPGIRLDRRYPLTLVPRAPRDVVASAVVSPLVTKLYQESGLRRSAGTAVVNPETARELRLEPGSIARLETRAGTAKVKVEVDAGVMPGVVALAIGPDSTALGNGGRDGARLVDLSSSDDGSVWRSTAARLVEV